MWSTTGAIFAFLYFSMKREAFSSGIVLNFQPLGLRVKIWNVLHSRSTARSTALSMDPVIETWTPIRSNRYPYLIERTKQVKSVARVTFEKSYWRARRDLNSRLLPTRLVNLVTPWFLQKWLDHFKPKPSALDAWSIHAELRARRLIKDYS